MSAATAYAAYTVATCYQSRAEMERALADAAATLERRTARWTAAFDRRHVARPEELVEAWQNYEAAYDAWVTLYEACHGGATEVVCHAGV